MQVMFFYFFLPSEMTETAEKLENKLSANQPIYSHIKRK